MDPYKHYQDKEEIRITALSVEKITTTKAQIEYVDGEKLPYIKSFITSFIIDNNHLITAFKEHFQNELIRELTNLQKVFQELLKDHQSMKHHTDQEISSLKITHLNKIESFYLKELVENINGLQNLINKMQIEIDSYKKRLEIKERKDVSKDDNNELIGF